MESDNTAVLEQDEELAELDETLEQVEEEATDGQGEDDNAADELIEIELDGETLTLGEEEEPEEKSETFKQVRTAHREATKELRKLRKELDEVKNKGVEKEAAPVVTKKPEYFDYDSEEDYEKAMVSFIESEREKQTQIQSQQQEIQEVVKNYEDGKSSLRKKYKSFRDFDEVEEVVVENLSPDKVEAILKGADDPSFLVYAVGKSPKLLKELSSISDPIRFAAKVGKIEDKMKSSMKKKAAAPAPERKVKGAKGSVGQNTLEKLREKGDIKGAIAYRRKLKAQKT
jgi:hypothetical protein